MKFTNTDLPFNPKPSTLLHIDLNSAFASIEQLADPLLRGKPVAVAAYNSPRGCVIAPSVEAKQQGIRVGMQVRDAQLLCRDLVVLAPDAPKYRSVHLKLKKLLGEYTDHLTAASIDEFILNLEGYPALRQGIHFVAREIKDRIKAEIGESLTVSIGIAPNRFLAKLAAGLHKPDGLDEINCQNFQEVYTSLQLMGLCGIKQNNCVRLNRRGIYTVMDFYNAKASELQAAFESVNGYYWYLRLHGWEPDDVDFGRKSFGNSFALPEAYSAPEELAPILMKLVLKTAYRMRRARYRCRGVHVAILYKDGTHWHHGVTSAQPLVDSRDIYKIAFDILNHSPYKKGVHTLAESVYLLERATNTQSSFLDDVEEKARLMNAVDGINERWGNYTMTPALMLAAKDLMPDRIAFGGVRELEEMVLS